MVYHISQLKKYEKCRRLFVLEELCEKEPYHPFVRMDEELTKLVLKKLGVDDYFLGSRGDDSEIVLKELDNYKWIVKARFEYKGLRVKIPILHKVGDKYDVYFIYVGLYPKVFEASFYYDNLWVLKANGIEVNNVFIVYLNKDYVREDELDPDKLFNITTELFNSKNNPTLPIKEALKSIDYEMNLEKDLKEMHRLIDEGIVPKAKKINGCIGRQRCKYYYSCFPNEEDEKDNSILTLNGSRYKTQMKKDGIYRLANADEELIEGTKIQYSQIMADKLNKTFVDKLALSQWLKGVEYPISFIDFEWERFAIPPYKGMKPYDVLPFEYSIHILYEDGRVENEVFLSIQDDRLELTKRLINDVPKEGTIIAFNATGAESLRIQELAEQFPQYEEELLSMNKRLKDLQIPFETGIVYDIRQRGLWSLKTIMSILDESSYKKLDIHDGMNAVFSWRDLDYDTESIDKEKIVKDLKEYCAMDSYAMLVIYKWLISLINN